ncbi:MAG TPA: sugar transferase [Candidatus Gastranaerophilales bacterium]|nr:sugar transferase [Candidatus Gastranaerophilales bacterium]
MTAITQSISFLYFTDFLIFISVVFWTGNLLNINPELIILFAILYTLFGIYVLYLKSFYSPQKFRFISKDLYSLFEALHLALIIPGIIALIINFSTQTASFIFAATGFSYISLLTWRVGFCFHKKNITKLENICVLGTSQAVEEVKSELSKRPELKLNVVEYKDEVDANGCKMPDIYEKITQKVPVEHITEDWFEENFNTKIKKPFYGFLKRIFDIGAALVILAVTFPIMTIIALSIKLADRGNIFYYQDRVGLNGKVFKMIKLRTMRQNAEKAGMVDKGNLEDDRIIPFCKWVRKARFDEIPQMINILKGDMSIVGPRAEFADFVKVYEKEILFYQRRHWITPGWTGWAQINLGHCVKIEDIKEKLKYDFYYIKHRNIFGDFNILLKAVFMALSGRHG